MGASVMNLLVKSSRSAVIEKSRCCRTRIPANSDSEVVQDPQRYKDFISHPFLTYFTIGQTNQEIVNMHSNDPFQLTVIRITTPQALISRHGLPSKLRKFLWMSNYHARCADVSPQKDFIKPTYRAGFPSQSENKFPTSGGALIVNS